MFQWFGWSFHSSTSGSEPAPGPAIHARQHRTAPTFFFSGRQTQPRQACLQPVDSAPAVFGFESLLELSPAAQARPRHLAMTRWCIRQQITTTASRLATRHTPGYSSGLGQLLRSWPIFRPGGIPGFSPSSRSLAVEQLEQGWTCPRPLRQSDTPARRIKLKPTCDRAAGFQAMPGETSVNEAAP